MGYNVVTIIPKINDEKDTYLAILKKIYENSSFLNPFYESLKISSKFGLEKGIAKWSIKDFCLEVPEYIIFYNYENAILIYFVVRYQIMSIEESIYKEVLNMSSILAEKFEVKEYYITYDGHPYIIKDKNDNYVWLEDLKVLYNLDKIISGTNYVNDCKDIVIWHDDYYEIKDFIYKSSLL